MALRGIIYFKGKIARANMEISKQQVRIAKYSDPVYDTYDLSRFLNEEYKSIKYKFEPYILRIRKPFKGEYVNISSTGIRKTVGNSNSESDIQTKKIFFFGGSTIWGTGSRDSDTIPSIFQKKIGTKHVVTNFGEHALVSSEELIKLVSELSKNNIPDVVIFYDGVNDGYAGAYSPAVPGDPHNYRLALSPIIEGDLTNKLLYLYQNSSFFRLQEKIVGFMASYKSSSKNTWDKKVLPKISKSAKQVIEIYEHRIKQIKALAQAYNFKVYFFWQPNLFSQTKNMTAYEKGIISNASPTFIKSQKAVYLLAKEKFENREDEQIYFLGNIFDYLNTNLYLDWCHVSPSANKIIVSEMLARLAL